MYMLVRFLSVTTVVTHLSIALLGVNRVAVSYLTTVCTWRSSMQCSGRQSEVNRPWTVCNTSNSSTVTPL